MTITRAIPEVRTTDVDKTIAFYCGLLGFGARMHDGAVAAFVSATHDGVEVIVDPGTFALPSGFTVEVATDDDVTRLFRRAAEVGVRIIEAPTHECPRLSVLDPSGRRVTVRAADTSEGGGSIPDHGRPILRTIPGSVLDAAAAKRFYADYLGFRVRREWPEVVMFEAPAGSGAQVLVGNSLTSPDFFDLDVGTPERVDEIHAAAVGNAVVMGVPQDFPAQGVRCFPVVDPNGVAINVAAHL